jgi:hypothetical protein
MQQMSGDLSLNNISRLFNYMRAQHTDFYQKISNEYALEFSVDEVDKFRLARRDTLFTSKAKVISELESIIEGFKTQEKQTRS